MVIYISVIFGQVSGKHRIIFETKWVCSVGKRGLAQRAGMSWQKSVQPPSQSRGVYQNPHGSPVRQPFGQSADTLRRVDHRDVRV